VPAARAGGLDTASLAAAIIASEPAVDSSSTVVASVPPATAGAPVSTTSSLNVLQPIGQPLGRSLDRPIQHSVPHVVTGSAAPRVPSGRSVRFKPLTDSYATRSVLLSIVGLLVFVVPVISLIALVFGLLSIRRIRRSDGTLVGLKAARWGALLGALGVIIGGVADVIFLAGR
jgi:hypothetical protein